MKKPTICIDPGHGGHDSGAVGPTGLKESMVVLAVGLMLERKLQPYCNVVMTRRDDRFITLSGRAKIANDQQADLFLSLHCNAGPPGQGSGFEVWTSPGDTESDKAATRLYNNYADTFPLKSRRFDWTDGDPDKESRFTVLVATRMAAVLFELEFIHTATGEDWLRQDTHHAMMVEALADGILEYFGIVRELPEEEPVVTPPLAMPVPEPSADAAMAWQRMVAGGPMEAQVAAASPRLLIDLRNFLQTQQPHGLISLGLGMVENEMIKRFTTANS